MATRFPGIIELCYMPAKYLPAYIDLATLSNRESVAVFYPAATIELEGEAECSAISTNENNGPEETATLSFQSVEDLPENELLAFLIRDVSDQWWVLGAKEEPGVKIQRENSLGTPSGKSAVNSYTVEYSGKKALVKCKLFR